MSVDSLLFADSSPDPEDCPLAIYGVPYDGTSSYRPGSRFAPNAIRQASYNFETYHMDRRVDLKDARFCDLGNLEEFGFSATMAKEVEAFSRERVKAGQVTLMLGGEHSITAPCVRAHGRPAFAVLDAHLDFRESYLDDPNSHASVTRRVTEHLGPERVLVVGVRSFSREEAVAAEEMGLAYVPSFDIHEAGVERVLKALEELPEKVYLSLDMDAVDPAYAPAVGNPEPFGLTPLQVKEIIGALGPRIVGFDVTEVSPPWDQGITAALAARIAREVIAVLHQAEKL